MILTFLLFYKVTIAQETDSAGSRVDSLIQNFISQNSVILPSSEVTGIYTFNEGFWSESIELTENGKFKIVNSACLGNAFIDKGTRKIEDNTIQMKSRNGEVKVAYLIQQDERVCLLNTSIIEEWKVVAENLPDERKSNFKEELNLFKEPVNLYEKKKAGT